MSLAQQFIQALSRRDDADAVGVARRMVAERTPLGDQWRSVARFAAEAREWTLALAAIDLFVQVAPGDPGRLMAKAEMLALAGRARDAAALVEGLGGDDPGVQHFLGTVYAELGEPERAAGHLRRALARAPGSGATWLALAALRRLSPDDADFRALTAVAPRMGQAPAAARAPFLYALGKAYDDADERGRAFEAFGEGAALIRAERPYDAAGDRAAAVRMTRVLDHNWIERSADGGEGASRAIFVTGLPRSGTTLVEQILTAHGSVADGGELNLLPRVAVAVGGFDRTSIDAYLTRNGGPDSAWEPVRRAYADLLSERFGEEGRIVDKSLSTSRVAHVVRMAMPDARLVWMRRDPLDTAWSCFRTFFARGLGWSFRLEDIGRHFAAEDLLFEHWRGVLGERMLVVPYADLVTDTAAWLPRIAAHVGLAVEQAMFDFHRSERAVATASVAQVRRPIYRSAVGSAAPYAARLAPFTAAYAAARAELGLPPSGDL